MVHHGRNLRKEPIQTILFGGGTEAEGAGRDRDVGYYSTTVYLKLTNLDAL
tara:strand:+ start:2074 stop:2226 length:153 start_codon:yes stop_codon:yes gene_type:complete